MSTQSIPKALTMGTAKINCTESFTEPLQIYHIARHRGMSLVTITDHNSIEGAIEIGSIPGFLTIIYHQWEHSPFLDEILR